MLKYRSPDRTSTQFKSKTSLLSDKKTPSTQYKSTRQVKEMLRDDNKTYSSTIKRKNDILKRRGSGQMERKLDYNSTYLKDLKQKNTVLSKGQLLKLYGSPSKPPISRVNLSDRKSPSLQRRKLFQSIDNSPPSKQKQRVVKRAPKTNHSKGPSKLTSNVGSMVRFSHDAGSPEVPVS